MSRKLTSFDVFTWQFALSALGWLIGWLLAKPTRGLPSETLHPSEIVLIVPAKNEEWRIPGLLGALKQYWQGDLIVVDNGSEDATAELAKNAGADVLSAPTQRGWVGKSWACYVGACYARQVYREKSVYVFLDADTIPSGTFLQRLAAHAKKIGGLVSTHPYHTPQKFHEVFSASCELISTFTAGSGNRSIAFGQALAIPSDLYFAIGGHEPIKASRADDLALARLVSRHARPVEAFLDDGSGITMRMYPEGFVTLARGWIKNLCTGALLVDKKRLILATVWITGMLQGLAFGLSWYFLVAIQHHYLLKRVGRYPWYTSVLWPLTLGVFVMLFVLSCVYELLGKRPSWRGEVFRK